MLDGAADDAVPEEEAVRLSAGASPPGSRPAEPAPGAAGREPIGAVAPVASLLVARRRSGARGASDFFASSNADELALALMVDAAEADAAEADAAEAAGVGRSFSAAARSVSEASRSWRNTSLARRTVASSRRANFAG